MSTYYCAKEFKSELNKEKVPPFESTFDHPILSPTIRKGSLKVLTIVPQISPLKDKAILSTLFFWSPSPPSPQSTYQPMALLCIPSKFPFFLPEWMELRGCLGK